MSDCGEKSDNWVKGMTIGQETDAMSVGERGRLKRMRRLLLSICSPMTSISSMGASASAPERFTVAASPTLNTSDACVPQGPSGTSGDPANGNPVVPAYKM